MNLFKTAGAIVLALVAGAAVFVGAARLKGGAPAPAAPLRAAVTAPSAAWVDAAPAPVFATALGSPAENARRSRQLEKALRARPVAAPQGGAWSEGARVELPLFDGVTVSGVVGSVTERRDRSRLVSGELADGGSFVLAMGQGGQSLSEALILPAGSGSVYRLVEAEGGGLLLAELPRDAVLCATLPRPPGAGHAPAAALASASGAATVSSIAPPLLESRPEAEPVLYLDFDGQTVNDPVWNRGATINAEPSGLSAEEMRRVWAMVAEDYRPFRINVTTDPARYASARPMQRMRCIITPTKAWYGDVGGVALIFSWRDAGAGTFAEDVPCWVFSEPGVMNAEDVALAVSHEAGHTLGLYHDGLRGENGTTPPEGDYYAGHGTGDTAWGPIMGAPYGKPLIQWSRGDYSVGLRVANNPQDDVALIATIENHVGYAAERRAASLADACRLSLGADGVTVDHRGLIERAGTEAWLILAAGAGPLSLELAPDDPLAPRATNFDGELTLATPAGAVVAVANQTGACFPKLSVSVPAGIYVLRVKSVGEGSPASGGYSNYGSIGRYRVLGRITAAHGVAPLMGGAPRGEGSAGAAFSYAIEAAGAGLVYAAADLPPGLTVGSDGRISGTPGACGVWNVSITASNGAGVATRQISLAIAGAGLAETLDAPALTFSTGGARPWRSVAEADAPAGGSNARSGELMDDNGESWIETTLTGPGRLKWLWRVSSEKDYDLFHAALDGSVVAAISGETPWSERALDVPAGTHVVRWSYDKDDYLSERADSAWLDGVRWERGFEQWATTALGGADAAPAADPDGDGVANLLEYALGKNPRTADGLGDSLRTGVGSAPASEIGGGVRLELTFVRPAAREDLRYVVEVSADLVTWSRGHVYGVGANNTGSSLPTLETERVTLPDGAERIRVRDATRADGAGSRRFIRLRIERT